MNSLIVIPARYGSTRLPSKPLINICGKPLIQWCYEAVLMTGIPNDNILVATDHKEIIRTVESFAGNAMMTSSHHESGTSRIGEVYEKLTAENKFYNAFINVQGDQPFVDKNMLLGLIYDIEQQWISDEVVITPIIPISIKDAQNPNVVKVVINSNKEALYFSRAIIPYDRDSEGTTYLSHVGMYAYTPEALNIICSGEVALNSTDSEKLEQIKWLSQGITIKTIQLPANTPNISVDVQEDVEKVMEIIRWQTMQGKS